MLDCVSYRYMLLFANKRELNSYTAHGFGIRQNTSSDSSDLTVLN